MLGCFLKDVSNLDSYPLHEDDFTERFHKILFNAIMELRESGCKTVDAFCIDIHLREKYPAQYEIFKKHQGVRYVQEAAAFASLENIESNYQEMLKWRAIRQLYSAGFDYTYFYDPDEVDASVIEEKAERFRNTTPEQMIGFYENQLQALRQKCRFPCAKSLTAYDPFELPNADAEDKYLIDGMLLQNTFSNIVG